MVTWIRLTVARFKSRDVRLMISTENWRKPPGTHPLKGTPNVTRIGPFRQQRQPNDFSIINNLIINLIIMTVAERFFTRVY